MQRCTSFYPSLSPDGQTIVFSSSRSNNFELYEMDIDGHNLRQLTEGLGSLYAPSISPDGRQIIFASYAPIDAERKAQNLWLIDRHSDYTLQLTFEDSGSIDPEWSPDGRQIAFASNRSGTNELYVMAADGSNVRQLTFEMDIGGRCDWSPNGRYLAFYAGSRKAMQIYLIEVDGGIPFPVTSNGDNKAPSFSLDGEWLTFTRRDTDGDNEIFIIRTDGTDLQQLTFNDRPDWQPRWGS
jgi:Tol biopolymer transport system component